MKYPQFEFYTRPNGRTEFIEFLQSIPTKDKQKLLATISVIQEQGLLVAQRMEWVKKLDSDIFEIRSKVSSNIQRALYFMLLMTALSLRIDLLRKRKRPLLLKYSTLKL